MKTTLLPLGLLFLSACTKTFDTGTPEQVSSQPPQVCDFGLQHFNLSKRPTVRETAGRKPLKQVPLADGGAVILLDFDGQLVSNTVWNTAGDIVCTPANLTTDAMSEIIDRVGNDYSPFNVNITTNEAVYNAAAPAKRMRVIITESYEWYGMAGGVGYIGSFNWGNNTPCFVFSSLLEYDTKKIAEAISHEAGHTCGLYHQSTYDPNCFRISDYNYGFGAGETGWAPIMGSSYFQNLTLWHNGPNSNGCNTLQDEVYIIGSATGGMRPDDYSNSKSRARVLTDTADGLINNSTDLDFFYIDIATTKSISAEPFSTGVNNTAANLDLVIKVYDNSGAQLMVIDNPQTLNVSTTLNPGKYYISVSTISNQYAGTYGMMGWYSISLFSPGSR